ncbi:hypothetical protein [Bradyrhizobium liaoningense]
MRWLTGQSASKRREIEFVRQELTGVRELWEKKLVPINRVMTLEREAERLAVALGAALFGIGMVVYGYCPGTALGAIATGSVHAWSVRSE